MTLPPERDSSGRFIKPEDDAPKPSDENMHPLSRLLFGWVSSPRTPLFLLILVILICAGLVVFDLAVNRPRLFQFCQCQWVLRDLGLCGLWPRRPVGLAARQVIAPR